VAHGIAQAGTDLHDEGGRAAKLGFGVEGVVRVDGGVGNVPRNVNSPPFRVLFPCRLPPALQARAAADKAHRPSAIRAEGRLRAGRDGPRDMRLLGVFWGFAHPFQNSGAGRCTGMRGAGAKRPPGRGNGQEQVSPAASGT
jgi:hypothetical protein